MVPIVDKDSCYPHEKTLGGINLENIFQLYLFGLANLSSGIILLQTEKFN